MKDWASEKYSGYLCLPTIGDVSDKELYRKYAEVKKCISKYISIGKLIISDEISKMLDELNQMSWNEDFNFADEGFDDRLEEIINLA